MLLLRIGKYKSTWEENHSILDILELEFSRGDQADLELSVYEVGVPDVVQIYVEHYAANNLKPPGGSTNLDFAGSTAVVCKAFLVSPFSLVNFTHRELVFTSREALIALLERVRSEFSLRAHHVTKTQARRFVGAREAARDSEWIALLSSNERWSKFAVSE